MKKKEQAHPRVAEWAEHVGTALRAKDRRKLLADPDRYAWFDLEAFNGEGPIFRVEEHVLMRNYSLMDGFLPAFARHQEYWPVFCLPSAHVWVVSGEEIQGDRRLWLLFEDRTRLVFPRHLPRGANPLWYESVLFMPDGLDRVHHPYWINNICTDLREPLLASPYRKHIYSGP